MRVRSAIPWLLVFGGAVLPSVAQQPAQQKSDFDRAIDLANQAEMTISRYLQGEVNPVSMADFESAAKAFQAAYQLSNLDEYHEKWLFCEGRARIFQRQYEQAINLLNQSIEIGKKRDPPSRSDYEYNALGLAYLGIPQLAEAKTAFETARDLQPRWVYPRMNLALIFLYQGEYEKTEAEYSDTLKLFDDPDEQKSHAYLNYNEGVVYQMLHKNAEAESMFQVVEELSQDTKTQIALAQTYNAIGVIQFTEGRFAEAEKLYKQALTVSSNFQAARHNLGLLYEAWGREKKAIEEWCKNDFTPSKYSLAAAYVRERQWYDAAEVYQDLLSSQPKATAARVALADILYQHLGQKQMAIDQLNLALRDEPKDKQLTKKLSSYERRSKNGL
jgi:tetratricopeptide (TPR) repeat protein